MQAVRGCSVQVLRNPDGIHGELGVLQLHMSGKGKHNSC
jgi:hypothetical protein